MNIKMHMLMTTMALVMQSFVFCQELALIDEIAQDHNIPVIQNDLVIMQEVEALFDNDNDYFKHVLDTQPKWPTSQKHYYEKVIKPALLYAWAIYNGHTTYKRFIQDAKYYIEKHAKQGKNIFELAEQWEYIRVELYRQYYLNTGINLDVGLSKPLEIQVRYLLIELLKNGRCDPRVVSVESDQVLNLRGLKLARVDFDIFNIQNAHEVTMLDLADNGLRMEDIWESILRCMPRLRYLDLRLNALTEEDIATLRKKFRNVEILA